MSLPPLNETTCHPGAVLRPHDVTYTEQDIEDYVSRTGESLDAYRRDGSLRVPPGMLLIQPIRIIHNNFHYETGVHVSSDLTLHRLPLAGDTVTIGGSVTSLFERNGSKYVALHVTISDPGGDLYAEIEHTSIYALAKH
jgi:hypothetical protein